MKMSIKNCWMLMSLPAMYYILPNTSASAGLSHVIRDLIGLAGSEKDETGSVKYSSWSQVTKTP